MRGAALACYRSHPKSPFGGGDARLVVPSFAGEGPLGPVTGEPTRKRTLRVRRRNAICSTSDTYLKQAKYRAYQL